VWTLLDGEGVWKHMFQNWRIKKIPICDLFYKVFFDTIGLLMAIKTSNKYVLIAIDHYFKWCEANPIKEHIIETIIKFLGKIFFLQVWGSKVCAYWQWWKMDGRILIRCVKILGSHINLFLHRGPLWWDGGEND
jgi:hypothetical protein